MEDRHAPEGKSCRAGSPMQAQDPAGLVFFQRGMGNHTVSHAGLISGKGIFRFVRSGDEINIVSKEQHGKP